MNSLTELESIQLVIQLTNANSIRKEFLTELLTEQNPIQLRDFLS